MLTLALSQIKPLPPGFCATLCRSFAANVSQPIKSLVICDCEWSKLFLPPEVTHERSICDNHYSK